MLEGESVRLYLCFSAGLGARQCDGGGERNRSAPEMVRTSWKDERTAAGIHDGVQRT